MSKAYKILDQSAPYFLTLQVVQWVDIFTRKIYRDIVLDSFNHCTQHKGLEIFAYVIMSNHIHIIARSRNGDLSGCIRDLRRYTSKLMMEVVLHGIESRRGWMNLVFQYEANGHNRNEQFQIWTHENHAEEIYSNCFMEEKINYIHQNPVRAGLVANPEDYLYSSARAYAGKPSRFEPIVLSFGWKTIR